ncbi:MAG: regulatory iron-sulfur-containing complex subunit RicT [Chloroflexota bacterium]|nr:regulatory iron-sulfur-containing complex subunit RicT [Chloroflexota bacterium]MDE2855722.1 regulatory iron-sulfur-containing complex subunit RicT [Chloroflexota bacterium]MDE2946976.1 regulatory iron-sulfur-containing complex subunit RicT [Chloroflexota bacterium]
MATAKIEKSELVAGVRFQKIGKLYHFDFAAHPGLKQGDYVIVDTRRGRQMGQIMGFTAPDDGRKARQILRPATPRDLLLRQHWEAQQEEALETCREAASNLRRLSDVKFVAAQYNYDGSVVTFLFSAEQKIDTTALQKRLQRKFEARIEMRQIGPRDVAKLLGGFGACGITRCCSTFLTDFSPISIKMAKAQGVSLNPSEITGMCGRLRCCLVYEYEQYVEARRQLPRRNKRVGTPHGEGRVLDQLPLRDAVLVEVGEGQRKVVEREDIIPLEEFRKLAEKAGAPCDKHGDGSCECGMPPGQRQADRLKPAPTAEPAAQERKKPEEEKKPRRRRSRKPRGKTDDGAPRSNRRRGRRRGGRRSNKDANRPEIDSTND